jgi:hypothetical protein
MTVQDWVHVAWSTLYFDIPALADSVRYRKWLYEAIWLGELSPELQAELDRAEHERVREGIGKGHAPQSALDELNRLHEMRQAQRREREGPAE